MGGAKVTVAGFCRGDEPYDIMQKREALSLGQSRDAAFVARAFATLKETLFHGSLKRYFLDCDTIVARNLEQLAIARAIVQDRPLVYECLDIHRSLVGTNLPSRTIRAVEGALLPRCNLLITSSPAFLRNHFDHRPLEADTLLVENKLLQSSEDQTGSVFNKGDRQGPITVGWFGMLRCKRTLQFLIDLVWRSNGTIEVLIAGKPSPAELPTLERDVADVPGIIFTGPYTYDELPDLYSRCDFAWAIDWFEEGLNSKWLLPNRLYEPIAFGAIPIALQDVEVGHWLDRHDAGLLVNDADEAAERLLTMTRSQVVQMRSAISQIDSEEVICSRQECGELVQTITALAG